MNVCVFLTYGQSLTDWKKMGTYSREMKIYESLRQYGHNFYFLSYGGKDDFRMAEMSIKSYVLYNKYRLPNKLYSLFLPLLHGRRLKKMQIFKTNQIIGAHVAIRIAKLFKIPVISRLGYMVSYNLRHEKVFNEEEYQYYLGYEKYCFQNSAQIIVTTNRMMEDIQLRFKNSYSDNMHVIPNYIDTELFQGKETQEKNYDIIIVGRISSEKNIDLILQALVKTRFKILIVGDGDLKQVYLKKYSGYLDRLTWYGICENAELPQLLNQSRIFLQCSDYEGNPKTILEAMSTGVPVVASNVPGIKDIIQHKFNGYLCDLTTESILNTVQYVLDNYKEAKITGEHGREYIIHNHSLKKISKEESLVYLKAFNHYISSDTIRGIQN